MSWISLVAILFIWSVAFSVGLTCFVLSFVLVCFLKTPEFKMESTGCQVKGCGIAISLFVFGLILAVLLTISAAQIWALVK